METKQYNILAIIFGSILFVCDMITKYAALHYCTRPIEAMRGVYCDVVVNTGIVWGVGAGAPWYVLALLYTGIGVIIAWLVSHAIHRWHDRILLPEVLVLSGAIANICDRIWYGGVIDFIRLSYGALSWPTFNIADIAIVCGIIGILYVESKGKNEA